MVTELALKRRALLLLVGAVGISSAWHYLVCGAVKYTLVVEPHFCLLDPYI